MKTQAIFLTAGSFICLGGCERRETASRAVERGPAVLAATEHRETADSSLGAAPVEESDMSGRVVKTDEQWRERLTSEQYYVTRQKGTEPAFTGQYWNHKGQGVYKCVCCGQELFGSDTQYDSGSGWPAFWAPTGEGQVRTEEDSSHGMQRVEVSCSGCDAHLGHVFDDGPRPTGLRYCINSAALDFEEED
jgi:peptide-methionine (R)-S-oxide reductase